MNSPERNEVINQVPFASTLEDDFTKRLESFTEFVGHDEIEVRYLVRYMLQKYADDGFLCLIGANHYERTPV